MTGADLHISLTPTALRAALEEVARLQGCTVAEAARCTLCRALLVDTGPPRRRGRPTTAESDAERAGVAISQVGDEWTAVHGGRIVAHGRDRSRVVRMGLRRSKS